MKMFLLNIINIFKFLNRLAFGYNNTEVVNMPTESFEKTIVVDNRSADCIEKILKSNKPVIITSNKSFRRLSKKELSVLFSKKKKD